MLNTVHNVYYTLGIKYQGPMFGSPLIVHTESETGYPVQNGEIVRTFYKAMLIVFFCFANHRLFIFRSIRYTFSDQTRSGVKNIMGVILLDPVEFSVAQDHLFWILIPV